jgi:eukaryotic-like serine/threonine-protein kinase
MLADEFAAMWAANEVRDVFGFLASHPAAAPGEQLNVLLVDQGERWRRGIEVPVEEYLAQIRAVADDESLKLRLVVGEFVSAASREPAPTIGEYLARFPELCPRLASELDKAGCKRNGAELDQTKTSDGCFKVTRTFDVVVQPIVRPSVPLPARIGRYAIQKLLGSGGFGRVYLGHDEELDRPVAIKVPREDRLATRRDQDEFIREAQLLARLEHAGIVPVYDVGRTGDGRCFIVSKYVDGSDLTARLALHPPTTTTSAMIVADVAEALHFAHSRRIVHRDVKPANILLDRTGRAFIADFGIALKEEDLGRDASIVGTLAYMSPEQLRGEGHLVDGRSDVFSLGVVFYELLTGQRPFSVDRLQQMASVEARPPRQLNDRLPRELERICLRALCKRAADRYTTAKDFAEDLRHWLEHTHPGIATTDIPPTVAVSPSKELETAPLRIVPKGLRCFDAEDTEFFLELIPGPRDRDGLPESIRFWKTRIESRDPEKAFRAGLIYGPSGCGKSSFLRAGLLPRLDASVTVIFVEAASEGTELRLLSKLRSAFPSLPAADGLVESLVHIRRGDGLAEGRKLLIVFDQFEQWLHSRKPESDSDLVQALRQCDGSRLQCLFGVRDDFWMGITQFMHDLDVDLAPEQNVAPLQLLSPRHARKVLIAFGRAFGALSQGDLEPEQNRFVDEVIENLAEQDRVIPVRLALFTEMIRDRSWHPKTLAAIGGMEGIGVAFLEDSFSSAAALPDHRLHQRAARAVLRSLLSDGGGTIKGDRRSREELLAASGYAENPAKFETLLRILDNDLRLITPTEPVASESENPNPDEQAPNSRYYHLTHDYLVPPLREWLTRKQKETRRGRADLLLGERAALWNARPANRSLPSFLEWLNILVFTTHGSRRGRQNQNLLRAAARFYVTRIVLAAVLMALIAWGATREDDRLRAQAFVNSLGHARTQDVPAIVAEMNPVRKWADPLLRARLASGAPSTPAQLHTAMALLPVDRTLEPKVYEGLLAASPKEIAAIRQSLVSGGDPDALSKRLWEELLEARSPARRRFRAGVALASMDRTAADGGPGRWQQASGFLAEQLIAELAADTTAVDSWIELLTPVRAVLYADLRGIFVDTKRPQIDRHLAATVLGEFVALRPHELVDLMLEAEPEQYVLLLPKLHRLGEPAKETLVAEFNTSFPAAGLAEDRRIPLRRHAHAAVALLEFGATEPLVATFSATSDPDLCTYAEDRVSSVAARPDLLLRLVETTRPPRRAAFLRCLAGMRRDKLPDVLKEPLASSAEHLFQTDPDTALHSAAEWALRSWGLKDRLAELSKTLTTDEPVRDRGWFVNHAGQTFAVFKKPIQVQTGSPPNEPGRDDSDEDRAIRTIDRDFAIATTEVTVGDFKRFMPNFRHLKKKGEYTPTVDCPMGMMTWHRAAEYCNWLSKQEKIPEDQWCYQFVKNNAKPYSNYLQRTGYRLPTDVEWEYACRAGTTTAFSWGNDPLLSSRFAWTISSYSGQTREVGVLCPNGFGLFDMHGNVAEWVQDKYEFKDDGQPVVKNGEDKEETGWELSEDSLRDTRGGSGISHVRFNRSANRTPTKARNGVSPFTGFRVARTLKLTPAHH